MQAGGQGSSMSRAEARAAAMVAGARARADRCTEIGRGNKSGRVAMDPNRRRVLRLAGAGLALPWIGGARADTYPSKPIRVVVPFAAGGPTDIVARVVAQKLSESWGQQLYIENVVGASGNIGTRMVARAAPDGYTVLVTTSGFDPVSYTHLDVYKRQDTRSSPASACPPRPPTSVKARCVRWSSPARSVRPRCPMSRPPQRPACRSRRPCSSRACSRPPERPRRSSISGIARSCARSPRPRCRSALRPRASSSRRTRPTSSGS